MSYHYIDIIFAVAALLICIYSFARGFLKRLSSLIAAIVCAVAIYFIFSYLKQFHFQNEIYRYVIVFIIFILIFLCVKLLVVKLAKNIKDTPVIGWTDKLLGLITGMLQSGIYITIASVILYYTARESAVKSVIVSFVMKYLI